MVAAYQFTQLPQTGRHHIENRTLCVRRHLLGQAGDPHPLLHRDFAVIGMQLPHDQFHQGGFSRAVSPKQADTLPLVDGKIHPLQQGGTAKTQLHIPQRHQSHDFHQNSLQF